MDPINIIKILIIVTKFKSWKSFIIFKYYKHMNCCCYVNSKRDLNTINFYVLIYFKILRSKWFKKN